MRIEYTRRPRRFGHRHLVPVAITLWAAWCCCESLLLAASPTPVDQFDLAQYFGFDRLEIYKVEQRSTNLLSGDMNGDGLTDLVFSDDSHSRIDLLLQRQTPGPQLAASQDARHVNDVAGDTRFQHVEIPVAKRVSALAVGDFNGDDRTDIAYFGLPDRLIIRTQPTTGPWTHRVSIRLTDVPPNPWTITVGDWNKDGRDDLAVLGKNDTYLLHQRDDGTMDRPRRLRNTSGKLGLAQGGDVDGDGLDDLCYVSANADQQMFCVRLQTAAHKLGPELQFDLNQPRAVTLANLDNAGGKEIVAIETQSGRIKAFRFTRPAENSSPLNSRPIQFGFGSHDSGRHRDLATGDVNQDGLTDVIVSDPESAQVILFQQHPDTGLDLGTTFPALDGTNQLRILPATDAKTTDIILLSEREKTVGMSRMVNGRLSFPRALPVQDDPVCIELADWDADGVDEIFYLSKPPATRSMDYAVRVLKRDGKGQWRPDASEATEANSPSAWLTLQLRSSPERLMRIDANGDNRPEFLVFQGSDRAPRLLMADPEGHLAEVQTQGGLQLGDVEPGAIFSSALSPSAILAAQGKFARSLRLDGERRWQVIDQYNAAETNANVVGVASLDLDGQPGDEIVLVDQGVRKLRVLRLENGRYRPWSEVDLGSFVFKACYVADFDNDKKDDLLLFGATQFALVYADRIDPRLAEFASYESRQDEDDVFLGDLVAGDLNGDGRVNVAALDMRSHFVEILAYGNYPTSPIEGKATPTKHGADFHRAMRFRVFEEKSFSERDTGGPEPRQAVIADVTHDGRADLILLAHDRILVYPQDDGNH